LAQKRKTAVAQLPEFNRDLSASFDFNNVMDAAAFDKHLAKK